ncbi:MAG TPA: DNA adenine methylase [Methanoregula sp.]|nr:DNA adenine methylase [Methanoregula sp.]
MKVPLVKWAGGKRQLLKRLNGRLPQSWGTYFEPFVGGGALLVDLHNQGKIKTAVISDLNSELINFYRVVQRKPEELIEELKDPLFQNTPESFREVKAGFNEIIGTNKNAVRRAAFLIYLNKHGFNGLWRVNSRGKYNVPFGSHAKRNIPSDQSILNFHAMLSRVTILNKDFEAVVKNARKNDLVYFDPPYQPISKTARFTGYNPDGFKFEDQERLAKVFGRLSDRGVLVMLSNSRIQVIEDLYEGFTIREVEAKRFINCNGQRRKGIFEIIVTNY